MTVMDVLPYIGHNLQKYDSGRLEELFEKLSNRVKNHDIVRNLQFFQFHTY